MAHHRAHKAIKTDVGHDVHDAQGEKLAVVEGGTSPEAQYNFTRPVNVQEMSQAVQSVQTAVKEEAAKPAAK